ncbi:PAS domain-containing protein [Streptomyces sp. NPDC002262]|uniref:PAS domain-containing protein n=1 Tax=Streptomyces sp. NPDC002262 TaxID=3154414 RepID=UPI003320FD76
MLRDQTWPTATELAETAKTLRLPLLHVDGRGRVLSTTPLVDRETAALGRSAEDQDACVLQSAVVRAVGERCAVWVQNEPITGSDTNCVNALVVPLNDSTAVILLFAAPKNSEDDTAVWHAHFASFMEHSPAAAAIFDERARFLWANPAVLTGTGLTWEQLQQLDVHDPLCPMPAEESELARRQHAEVMATGQPVEVNGPVTLAAGRRHIAGWLFPLNDSSGRRLVGEVVVDVTAELQARAALRTSEERFRSFMDHSPTLAMIWDEEGRRVWANEQAAQLQGPTPQAMIGAQCPAAGTQQAAASLTDAHQKVLATGRSVAFRGRVPHTDGRLLHTSGHLFPLRDANGDSLVGHIAIDITAQVEAERRAAHHALLFRAFMETSPAHAAIRDGDGTVVWANNAYARLLGLPLNELIGHPLTDVLTGNLPDHLHESIRQITVDDQHVLQTGRPRSYRHDMVRADGSVRSTTGYRFPLTTEDGTHVVGITGVDDTEQQQLRTELTQAVTRYHALLNRSGVALAALDAQQRVQEISPELARYLGRSVSSLHRTRFQTLLAPADAAAFHDQWHRLITAKTSRLQIGLSLLQAGDVLLPVRATFTSLPGHDSTLHAVIVLVERPTQAGHVQIDRKLRLSHPEARVLELIAMGNDNNQIARHLAVSRSSIDRTIFALRHKLAADTRAALPARAYSLGLFRPGQWPPRLTTCSQGADPDES